MHQTKENRNEYIDRNFPGNRSPHYMIFEMKKAMEGGKDTNQNPYSSSSLTVV